MRQEGVSGLTTFSDSHLRLQAAWSLQLNEAVLIPHVPQLRLSVRELLFKTGQADTRGDSPQ